MRLLSDHTIPDSATPPSDAIVTMSQPPFAILGGKNLVQHQPPSQVLCILEHGLAFAPAFVFECDVVFAGRIREHSRDGASSYSVNDWVETTEEYIMINEHLLVISPVLKSYIEHN